MTGRIMRAPPVVPYKALEKFSKALYGTAGGTYSARVFRPVMTFQNIDKSTRRKCNHKGDYNGKKNLRSLLKMQRA